MLWREAHVTSHPEVISDRRVRTAQGGSPLAEKPGSWHQNDTKSSPTRALSHLQRALQGHLRKLHRVAKARGRMGERSLYRMAPSRRHMLPTRDYDLGLARHDSMLPHCFRNHEQQVGQPCESGRSHHKSGCDALYLYHTGMEKTLSRSLGFDRLREPPKGG